MLSSVGLWIKLNSDIVQDLLCLAMERIGLSKEQFLGISFAAMMAGGRSWQKLPTMLVASHNMEQHLDSLVGPLKDCDIPETAA